MKGGTFWTAHGRLRESCRTGNGIVTICFYLFFVGVRSVPMDIETYNSILPVNAICAMIGLILALRRTPEKTDRALSRSAEMKSIKTVSIFQLSFLLVYTR